MLILVVDDDGPIREILAEALPLLLGAEVVSARGGGEGVAMATARRFDVALLDVVMPGMNGIELAARLRAMQPGIDILFMTGYGTNVAGLEKEIVIDKPFQFQEVKAAFERLKG